jgi:hypothetical protein
MSGRDVGPSAAQIARMRRKIDDRVAAVERGRFRRRRALVGVVAVAAATTIAAAQLNAAFTPEETAGLYICHLVDVRDTETHGITYPLDLMPPRAGTDEEVDAAIEMCGMIYAQFGLPVPDPAVCRLFDGRVAVFPNEAGRENGDFCSWIGLPGPGSDVVPRVDRYPAAANPTGT